MVLTMLIKWEMSATIQRCKLLDSTKGVEILMDENIYINIYFCFAYLHKDYKQVKRLM